VGHIVDFITNAAYILIAIFALGLVVVLHELGHFIVARYFGVRVDVFSFGFGPRIFGLKRGPTDYRISALPFGGYVRMAGDNPSEERAGAPDEFLSKPRWQRALIAVAGPAMNCILGVVLFAAIFGGNTQEPAHFPKPVIVAGVLKNSLAEKAGIQAGDELVSINGVENPTWERAHWETVLSAQNVQIPITIDRQGQLISTSVRSAQDDIAMYGYSSETVTVDRLIPGDPAQKAGLKPGDVIVSLDGQPIVNFQQLVQLVDLHQDRPIQLGISRNGHPELLQVRTTRKDAGDGSGTRGTIGFYSVPPRTVTVDRGIIGSVEFSTWFSTRLCAQFVQTVGQLFVGKASPKEFLGPLGIVTYSGKAARRGSRDLFFLTALISLNLAVLNLLPIPILDGGHIFMLGIEGAIRQDLSLKTKERFIQVGFVFILIIFAFVMYNDVLRLFTHS
jgi:regulator of sigma E protease